MLYFNRTGVSEGIDINKTNTSKERFICHYQIKGLSLKWMLAIGAMMF